MIRLSTPYPRHDLTLEDNLSDVDLYDEARRATSLEYVVIPELVQPSIEWDVPQAEDWTVSGMDTLQRLAQGQCWTYRDNTH